MYYVTWYNEAHIRYFVLMVWLLHYLNKGIVQLALAIGSDADPDISIRGGETFFVIKQKSDFKQFVLK